MLRQRSPAARAQRRADMGGGRREIGVAERNQFRARRGARGMQQQRDVVGLRQFGCGGRTDRLALDAKASGRLVLERDQPQHADPKPFGDCDSRACLVLGDEDRLRSDIGQVEIEFVGAVGRVERCGRGACGDRQEGRRHLRPVRQHDRDAVATADAARVQLLRRRFHLAAQRAMRQRIAFGREDRRRVVRAGGKPRYDRRSVRQRGPRGRRRRRYGP